MPLDTLISVRDVWQCIDNSDCIQIYLNTPSNFFAIEIQNCYTLLYSHSSLQTSQFGLKYYIVISYHAFATFARVGKRSSLLYSHLYNSKRHTNARGPPVRKEAVFAKKGSKVIKNDAKRS